MRFEDFLRNSLIVWTCRSKIYECDGTAKKYFDKKIYNIYVLLPQTNLIGLALLFDQKNIVKVINKHKFEVFLFRLENQDWKNSSHKYYDNHTGIQHGFNHFINEVTAIGQSGYYYFCVFFRHAAQAFRWSDCIVCKAEYEYITRLLFIIYFLCSVYLIYYSINFWNWFFWSWA